MTERPEHRPAPGRGARRIAAIAASLALASAGAFPPCAIASEATAIVKGLCGDERQAVHNYRAYSRRALEEGNPAVAHFFEALASSESVHARNFLEQLRRMGVAEGLAPQDPSVQSSRKNLRQALEAELKEIDTKYPGHIERLRRERQEDAIRVAIWAWESEKQHRELITQLEQGTGLLFGVLESKLQSRHLAYVICQVCGSTYVQRPEGDCPICGSAAANYREIPPPAYAKERQPGR